LLCEKAIHLHPTHWATPFTFLEDGVFSPKYDKVLKVKKKDGEIIHELDRPLEDKITLVTMQLNWELRFKNMRYHTLLHVISGYTNSHYNALATSSQIEEDYGRLELNFPGEIVDSVPFSQLEQSLKELLVQPHNVYTETIGRKEAEKREGLIKTTINLLPASLNEIRIVKVNEIDEQPCWRYACE